MKHLSYRYGILTLFSMFNLMGMTSNNSVLALPEGEIANQVCTKGGAAVVTVKGNGHGSGFLVSQDGLIITNAHVVDGGPSVVTVVFRDGKQIPADVIGFARGGVDLAALKIQNRKNLPHLSLAASGAAKVVFYTICSLVLLLLYLRQSLKIAFPDSGWERVQTTFSKLVGFNRL